MAGDLSLVTPGTDFAPQRNGGPRRGTSVVALVLVVAGLILALVARGAAPAPRVAAGASSSEVTVVGGSPASLDPAVPGDIGSAAVTAQLFETLTAFDPGLVLRPALAESWSVAGGGRTVTFRLRAGLAFSDGTALTAADVVRSWLRLIDPAAPSPLASLLSDVVGADDYRAGRLRDPARVGLAASGTTITVSLINPASDFPSIVAAAPFAVVPPGITDRNALAAGSRFVGSGGYTLAAATATELTLKANPRYWAGVPAIATVHLLTSLGGRSPVQVFQEGGLDYTAISTYDASWIRFDPALGPSLRSVRSLSLEYLGFDASRPPFNDVLVRRAVGAAVDWQRIVQLANPGDDVSATSMVPPGIPGRDAASLLPAYDPTRAASLLAQAGYPGGRGFPPVTFVTAGSSYAAAIRAAVTSALGIQVGYETMDDADYFERLATDPPQMWTLGWVADYPGPNDFLGVLLGSGSTNNTGRWSSAEFDRAIADAGSGTDQAAIDAAFGRALAIVQRDVPVVPLAYGDNWALSRKGLLGAGQNGLGILRLAGLAWAP